MNNRIKNKNYFSTALSLFYLLIFCCIAFWPLTFHLFSLKNDALNYFLPVRHQVSEAFYNGYFPYWSPYFNLGYPLHGDMQSGVWNPFVQLFSLFGPYTLKTLQYETILYVYLSGAGMFFLIKHFTKDTRISILIATAFMLSGFNSDSAQFLNWISGASFLPFVFLFYYRTLSERSWKAAVFFAFFLYLLFSTAYPADFVILFYLLIAVSIWFLISNKIYKSKVEVWGFIKLHAVAVVCFLLLSLPQIISYTQSLSLTERGTGASFEDAMSNPLHPLLIFTYITPLPAWKAPYVWITDPLERNNFIGLLTFTLLIFGLLIKTQSKLVKFCKWALVVSFIFSLGEFGLLRPLTYYILPLMDTFRHPANAKLFTNFFACIIAAFTLQQGLKQIVSQQKKRLAFFIVCFLFSAMLIWAFTGNATLISSNIIAKLNDKGTIGEKLKSILEGVNFYDLIFLNIIIQLPFIIALYFFFVKRFQLKYLIIIGITNSIIHSALFQPFTVIKKDSAAYIQQVLNSVKVEGYPLPDYSATLYQNSENGDSLFNEIGNINMYNKKIGRVDYRISPSNLLNQNEFWFNSKLRDELFNYPLLYRADSALHIRDTSSIKSFINTKIVIVEDEAIKNRINKFNNNTPASITAKTFSPNTFQIKIESSEDGYYNLFQNYYPNWNLFIDGKKAKIEKTNVAFMGFFVPKGKHLIQFKYEATVIKMTFFLNLIVTFLIIFLGIYWEIKSYKIKSSSLS